jgi:6-bladed beta-propeller
MIKKIMFIFACLILFVNIHAIEISKINTITIDQENVILQRVIDFCVIKDDNFLFPDMKAGDIKIYDTQGKLIKVWGRKGEGPGEFIRPVSCDYNQHHLIIMDWGKRKLLIYKEIPGLHYKKINEKLILALAYDVKYINQEKILISGYKSKSQDEEYGLYYFYHQTGKIDFLLPAHLKYGFSSHAKYKSNFLTKIAPIGVGGYCDNWNNNIYTSWTGNLKIIRINSDTKKISHFGLKTMNYTQPVATPRIVRLYNERSDDLDAEMQKISYVTGIFADEGFVGITYANFKKEVEGWQTIVQFYNHNDEFLKEVILPGAINTTTYADPSFCYVKESNTLYYLARTMDEEFNDIFKILKFKITP